MAVFYGAWGRTVLLISCITALAYAQTPRSKLCNMNTFSHIYQTKVKTLESKLKYKHKSIDRKLHSKVAYYKRKSQQKQKEIEEIENQCDHCDMLDKENATLKQVNKDILEANAELKGQLQAVQATH